LRFGANALTFFTCSFSLRKLIDFSKRGRFKINWFGFKKGVFPKSNSSLFGLTYLGVFASLVVCRSWDRT
jgi:hypothetical protein